MFTVPAPFVFTKVMKCLIKFWRINSVCMFPWLSFETTLRKSMVVKNYLNNAGFIVNDNV